MCSCQEKCHKCSAFEKLPDNAVKTHITAKGIGTLDRIYYYGYRCQVSSLHNKIGSFFLIFSKPILLLALL